MVATDVAAVEGPFGVNQVGSHELNQLSGNANCGEEKTLRVWAHKWLMVIVKHEWKRPAAPFWGTMALSSPKKFHCIYA